MPTFRQIKNIVLADFNHLFSNHLLFYVEDCKNRWRNLRDYYMRKKRHGKRPTGSAASDTVADEKLEKLKFIDAPLEERQSECNEKATEERLDALSPEKQNNEQEEDQNTTIQIKTEEVEYDRDDPGSDQALVDNDSTDSVHTVEKVVKNIESCGSVQGVKRRLSRSQSVGRNAKILSENTPIRRLPKNSKRSVKQQMIQEIQQGRKERLKLLREISQNRTNICACTENPIEIFFKSMAATVKTFSPKIASEAKMRVCKVITELEQRSFSQEQSSRTSSSFSNYSEATIYDYFSNSPPPPCGSSTEAPSPVDL